ASFSAGSTGFTPNSATTGAVTLAGTLATTNGGTGLTSFTANRVFYASSTSAIAQSANLTFDGTTLTAANFTDSSLTSGRVTYATTGGNLTDSANLTFDGTSLTLGGNPTLSAGTANGVAYLNGSKVLTTGSGFNTDGTNIGIGVGATSGQRVYARTATDTGTAYYADNGVNTGFIVRFAPSTTLIGNDFNQPLDAPDQHRAGDWDEFAGYEIRSNRRHWWHMDIGCDSLCRLSVSNWFFISTWYENHDGYQRNTDICQSR
ncbi:MAG: hypothetical protein EBS53_12895, partial [Bacteroidetes bacterium]|nr:hypothetical protein [Bacteroidota bacterium]